VIDCETDSKLRTLADVRLVLRIHGGNPTPTGYLFAKKGRIVFEEKEGVDVDEVFEPALEAGALDVTTDDDGRVVVVTEPNETKAVGESLSEKLDVQIATSEIVWDPIEDTKVAMQSDEAAQDLTKFLDALQERESSLQGVYMNVSQGSADDEAWAELRSRMTA